MKRATVAVVLAWLVACSLAGAAVSEVHQTIQQWFNGRVQVTGQTDGEVLKWDAATGQWVSGTAGSGADITVDSITLDVAGTDHVIAPVSTALVVRAASGEDLWLGETGSGTVPGGGILLDLAGVTFQVGGSANRILGSAEYDLQLRPGSGKELLLQDNAGSTQGVVSTGGLAVDVLLLDATNRDHSVAVVSTGVVLNVAAGETFVVVTDAVAGDVIFNAGAIGATTATVVSAAATTSLATPQVTTEDDLDLVAWGAGAAIDFNVAGAERASVSASGVLSVTGSVATPTVDALAAGALTVGAATATSVDISASGETTTVKGVLTVDETSTLTGEVTASGGIVTDAITLDVANQDTFIERESAGTVEINATQGTGNGDGNLLLNVLTCNDKATAITFDNAANTFHLAAAELTFASTYEIKWTDDATDYGTEDTFLGRESAGALRVGASTGGANGTISLATLNLGAAGVNGTISSVSTAVVITPATGEALWVRDAGTGETLFTATTTGITGPGADHFGVSGSTGKAVQIYGSGGTISINCAASTIFQNVETQHYNDIPAVFGTTELGRIHADTSPTQDVLRLDLSSNGGRMLYLGDLGNTAVDPGLSARTNPTLVLASATSPATNPEERAEISRTTSATVIADGEGVFRFAHAVSGKDPLVLNATTATFPGIVSGSRHYATGASSAAAPHLYGTDPDSGITFSGANTYIAQNSAWLARFTGSGMALMSAGDSVSNTVDGWDMSSSGLDLGTTTIAEVASGTAIVKNAANGHGLNIRSVETTLIPLGASATWTGAFPAGCIQLGATAYVVTTLTSGDGGTTFDLGDSGDADRFATGKAFASGTTVAEGDYTATPLEWNASAEDIVITPDAGTFSGGAIRVVAVYLDPTAPTQ